MKTFLRRLKEKWGITSNWQFVLVNIIFAITGSITVYIKRSVFQLLGIGTETPFLSKVFYYLLLITPLYFILLLAIGSLLGQFRFFWNFEKIIFRRLDKNKRPK